jgi:multidrug transporter EmrE-like cation transporter
MHWLALILAILSSVAANIALRAAVHGVNEVSFESVMRFVRSGGFALAVVACGLLFVSYVLAIRRIPLSIAYPVLTASSMVLVSVMSSAYFHDFVWSKERIAATAIILIGVVMLAKF